MVEPPPSEGGEVTITATSALAAVGQYLSTNSAKSTFPGNTGLVVKASRPNCLMIKICKLKQCYICAPDTSSFPNKDPL